VINVAPNYRGLYAELKDGFKMEDATYPGAEGVDDFSQTPGYEQDITLTKPGARLGAPADAPAEAPAEAPSASEEPTIPEDIDAETVTGLSVRLPADESAQGVLDRAIAEGMGPMPWPQIHGKAVLTFKGGNETKPSLKGLELGKATFLVTAGSYNRSTMRGYDTDKELSSMPWIIEVTATAAYTSANNSEKMRTGENGGAANERGKKPSVFGAKAELAVVALIAIAPKYTPKSDKPPGWKSSFFAPPGQALLPRDQCDNENDKCPKGHKCGRNKYGDIDPRFSNYNPKKGGEHCCNPITLKVQKGEQLKNPFGDQSAVNSWCSQIFIHMSDDEFASSRPGNDKSAPVPLRINACRSLEGDCPTGSFCGINRYGDKDGGYVRDGAYVLDINPKKNAGVCCSWADNAVKAGETFNDTIAWCKSDAQYVTDEYHAPPQRKRSEKCNSDSLILDKCPLKSICGFNEYGDEDGDVTGVFNPRNKTSLGMKSDKCCRYDTKNVESGEQMDNLAWCKDDDITAYETPPMREIEPRCSTSECSVGATCGFNTFGDVDGSEESFNPPRSNAVGMSTGLCCSYGEFKVIKDEMYEDAQLAWCEGNRTAVTDTYEHPYSTPPPPPPPSPQNEVLIAKDRCDNANGKCDVGALCGQNRYGDRYDGRFANYNPSWGVQECCDITKHEVSSGDMMSDNVWCDTPEAQEMAAKPENAPLLRINVCRSKVEDCPAGSRCGVNMYGEEDGGYDNFDLNPLYDSGVCCSYDTKTVVAGDTLSKTSAWCKKEADVVEVSYLDPAPRDVKDKCNTEDAIVGSGCEIGTICGVNKYGEDDGTVNNGTNGTFNPKITNMFGVDTGLCCSYNKNFISMVAEGTQLEPAFLCDDVDDMDTCRKVSMAWCNHTNNHGERMLPKFTHPVVREMEVRCASSACPLDAVCGINALGDEDGNDPGDFNPKRANMLGTSTGLCCDYETKSVKEDEMVKEWFALAWCQTNLDDGLLESYQHPYEGSTALSLLSNSRKRTRRSRTLLSEDADDEEVKEEEELERSGVEYAYSVIGKVAVDAAWPLDNNASMSIAAHALFKFPCAEGEFSSGSGTMTLDGVPNKVRNGDMNLVPVSIVSTLSDSC
jgi:hypothetical protein